jgi:hypothetical protein
MSNEAAINIEKLVYACFKELTNHTLQSEVISPHIKAINHHLENILKNVEKIDDYRVNPISYRDERNYSKSTDRALVLRAAYAMSRFDFPIINDILNKRHNQSETFQYLAKRLNVKAATLRNYRDMFDPYVKQENSHRKGWHQLQLSDEYHAIKKEYDGMDYELIKNEIAGILSISPNSDLTTVSFDENVQKGDTMAQHIWTKDDDIVAYYLCRYGLDSLLLDINGISKKLGMTPASMKMRVGNFKALEAHDQGNYSGLSNWANLSEEVFNHYKNVPKSEHMAEIRRILF